MKRNNKLPLILLASKFHLTFLIGVLWEKALSKILKIFRRHPNVQPGLIKTQRAGAFDMKRRFSSGRVIMLTTMTVKSIIVVEWFEFIRLLREFPEEIPRAGWDSPSPILPTTTIHTFVIWSILDHTSCKYYNWTVTYVKQKDLRKNTR